jgi:transcriptional regulator with XRE-family HTH domain
MDREHGLTNDERQLRLDIKARREPTVMIPVKLSDLRRDRGLTQRRVAELSGVGEKTLSSFETGERLSSLKIEQLIAILAVYDVTLAEFFREPPSMEMPGKREHNKWSSRPRGPRTSQADEWPI